LLQRFWRQRKPLFVGGFFFPLGDSLVLWRPNAASEPAPAAFGCGKPPAAPDPCVRRGSPGAGRRDLRMLDSGGSACRTGSRLSAAPAAHLAAETAAARQRTASQQRICPRSSERAAPRRRPAESMDG